MWNHITQPDIPMNHKQRELVQRLFANVREQYPEISLAGYALNPDDKNHIWVIVNAPMDEDREIEMRHFAVQLEGNIAEQYGYEISLMYNNPLVAVPLYGQSQH
jgi:hypothetical protein